MIAAIERAERGLIDADLGDGVIKQRIARPGEGRSGGYRTVIIYLTHFRAIFIHGFAKNDSANIKQNHLVEIKKLAEIMLSYDDNQISHAIAEDELIKVIEND